MIVKSIARKKRKCQKKGTLTKEKTVQTVPHTIYQKGVGEMREPPKIINCIELDGKEVLFEELSEEQRRQVSQILLDNFMAGLGYIRKQRSA